MGIKLCRKVYVGSWLLPSTTEHWEHKLKVITRRISFFQKLFFCLRDNHAEPEHNNKGQLGIEKTIKTRKKKSIYRKKTHNQTRTDTNLEIHQQHHVKPHINEDCHTEEHPKQDEG